MFDRNLWNQAKKFSLPLLFTILIGALIGGLIVWQAWLISQVIARVFIGGESLADVDALVTLLLLVILLRAAAVFGREISAGVLSVSVKTELREQVFNHLLALGPQLRETEQTGELSNTLVQGIEKLDAYFRQYLPQLALSALVPLTILLVVFPVDWLTGLVFLLTAPLIPFFMVLIARQAEKETNRQWRLLSRLSSHFHDVLQGLTTLKSFGRSKQQAETIRGVSGRYAQATLRVLRIAFLSALVLELLATISTAVVAVQIGLRLLYGHLPFDQALFVLILAPEYYLPLRQLGASFHAGMEGISAAARIFELLAEPVKGKTQGTRKVFSLDAGVEFHQVSYAYQNGDRPALKAVDFSLLPGQVTALVGASGAGKSTIARLLIGFLQPDSGQVLVGDLPLTEIKLHSWREKIAWVPQFPYLFHGTIEENIRMVKPDATHQAIESAANKANASEFILSLPEGYHTQIGERGARLSGGQAQRIALARAFLKNAPLVILDEPGANLDTHNLELIEQALNSVLKDRTALVIAHRMSTVKRADQIVVLDEGRVVQIGTHQDLSSQQGKYRELITAATGEKR
jgi:ATP-binding cassette subfamily C protein CydD